MASVRLSGTLLETIADSLMVVSEEFERWGEPYVRGPGLYVLIVDGTPASYSDPMGNNTWPVDDCPTVTNDIEQFIETAKTVGATRDGAIVVTPDGRISEQMIRLHGLNATDQSSENGGRPLEYEDWMGARHMSALEASTRTNVVATITLSEENGRVSVFVDGEHRMVK